MSLEGQVTPNLRQGGDHRRLPPHAVSDENALLNVQLSQEVFQILGHRLVGQHWAVRAVAMVTGIDSQHLTGQGTVRALGMRQQGGKQVRGCTRLSGGCCKQRHHRALKCRVPPRQLRLSINTHKTRARRRVASDYNHRAWQQVPTRAYFSPRTSLNKLCIISNVTTEQCLHECVTFLPVRCTKDFAIEWKFDLLPKSP